MMETAKIFANGGSQAVRLPKECRFDDDEVLINHIGSVVILMPKNDPWTSMMSALQMFTDDCFVSASGRRYVCQDDVDDIARLRLDREVDLPPDGDDNTLCRMAAEVHELFVAADMDGRERRNGEGVFRRRREDFNIVWIPNAYLGSAQAPESAEKWRVVA